MKNKIITSLAIAALSCIGANAQVSSNGLLKVNGNQIENESGTPYSVAGNSIFWSGFETVGGKFYTSEVVDHLAQSWGSQVVRAAVAVEEADDVNINNYNTNFPGGLVPNPDGSGLYNNYERELAKAKVIIDAAIENDIYVIVDFHSHYAHHFQDIAIQFFTEIATEYGNNDHIIYEIFNEPINSNDFRIDGDPNTFGAADFEATWNGIIRPYAIDVINAIRAIDPDNLIVVGTPGFSQGVGTASNNPITEGDLNLNGADLNIAYTLHFYAAGGYHDHLITQQAQVALDNGVALFVTEWGTVEPSGDGAVDQEQTLIWLDFLKQNNISHANWSITDKFEGSAVLAGNAGVQGLLDDQLSISGEFVRCIIEGWQSDEFGSCEAGMEEETEDVDSALVPNGVGIRFEVEEPTELDANTNSRIDFISPGVSVDSFDGEGILTGFAPGESVVVNANDFLANDSYTVQIVASSTAAGNFILLLDDEFGYLGGDVATSTSLDNYEIIIIAGVEFGDNLQNIRIAIGDDFSGSMNIESVYLIPDSEYDAAVLSVPTFGADLANLVSVYPNPVVDNINVNTAGNEAEYRIFSLAGNEIISKTDYDSTVDVSSLSAGIYFMQLYINGQTQVFKFVKQ